MADLADRRKSPHQQRVESFMHNAGQAVPDKPTVPDEATRVLRAKLILEEALETVHALGVRIDCHGGAVTLADLEYDGSTSSGHILNLVEIADGCSDISVVTIGTLSACGIADTALIEAIDQSNLAKFETVCPACGSTKYNVITEGNPQPGDVCCDTCGHEYRTGYRRGDGKWVKPADWKAPDIAAILAAQS